MQMRQTQSHRCTPIDITASTLILALFIGCADRRGVEAPLLDPDAAVVQIFNDYDKNRDGFLDAAELANCPSLQAAAKRLDKDGDQRLSRDEVLKRFEEYDRGDVGLYVTTVKVQLDGKPLGGASVEFEPEGFMGAAIQTARGTTDDAGRASLRLDGSELPGCQFGFFRVRISKKDADGKERIPARYRQSLGTEVPNPAGAQVFNLNSK